MGTRTRQRRRKCIGAERGWLGERKKWKNNTKQIVVYTYACEILLRWCRVVVVSDTKRSSKDTTNTSDTTSFTLHTHTHTNTCAHTRTHAHVRAHTHTHKWVHSNIVGRTCAVSTYLRVQCPRETRRYDLHWVIIIILHSCIALNIITPVRVNVFIYMPVWLVLVACDFYMFTSRPLVVN